jgi:hypothetical protein
METLIHVILWMVAIYLSLGLTATFFGMYFLTRSLLKIRARIKNENL